MGSILENTFAQLLTANRFELRYLSRKNAGELDFVVQKGTSVLPMEIRSGNDFKRHAAFNNALNVKEWNLTEGLVFCMGNLEQEENIIYYPWYMIMFFHQVDMGKFIVKLDLSDV